jgi:alginate production protein
MGSQAQMRSQRRIKVQYLALLIGLLPAGYSSGAAFEYDQKLSIKSAYADYETLGNPSDGSFQIKYEGFAKWDFPEGAWPEWSLFLRPWLSYRSEQPLPFLAREADTSARVNGAFAELWEFVFTRHNLRGNPALALSLGRQQYSGEYGFWWDDSIESLKLGLADSRNRGFVALGSRQYLYNTDDNKVSPADKDIVYLLGEYHYLWSPNQWVGLKLVGQRDYSPANDVGDEGDFTGFTLGVQLEGERLQKGALNGDYHFELATIQGEFNHLNVPGFTDETMATSGWLAFTELGHSFETTPVISRLAVRLALTDSPETPFSGFFQNTIQSSRASRFSEYNIGLSGAIMNVSMTNLMLASLLSQHRLSQRSQLRFSFHDLRRRNTDIATSRTIGLDYPESDGNHIGNILEAQYFWAMFPYAFDDEHLTFDVLGTLSYFQGGDALQDGIEDYQVSLDLNLRY